MMVRNLLVLWLCCVSQTKIRIRAHMNLPCGRCQLNEYTAIKRGATMRSPADNIFCSPAKKLELQTRTSWIKPLQPSTGPWSLGQPLEKKFLPQITDSIYNAIASLKKIHRAGEQGWSNSSLEKVQQQLQTIKVIKVTADDMRTWLFWVFKNIISAQNHKIAKADYRGFSTPVKPSVCSFPFI